MSDVSQGPGWWQASDDKWYPPDQVPGPDPAPGPGGGWATPPTGWGAPGASGPGAPGFGPPAYGAPGYGPPGPGYGPAGGFASSPYGAPPSSQGMGTASMVLGIVSLVLFWCWFLAIIPALVGLVLGLVALSRIKSGAASDQGRGMAVAGVVCSGIALAISIGFFVLIAAS